MANVLDLKKLRKEIIGNEIPEIEAPKEKLLLAADTDQETRATWEAPEYIVFPKKRLWFLILAAATAMLAGFSFYYANYFFTLFIILAGFLVAWFAVNEPKHVRFAITPEGVRFKNRVYLYEDLKSFWVFDEEPPFGELSIESKKVFMPYLKAPLGNADPDEIRKMLLKFLPEEQQNESLITLFSHILRF
ncbi:MAG: hypothetical protein Q7S66_06085 [bacterium]|nr:hypothetical protein [bacterium]